ncbi:MAG: stage II sporulation protein M [Firmicutes bacterium]|nr:stage II sporulation protein M [Bacillota bacterium]
MNQDVFTEEKRQNWKRLEEILSQIKVHGIKSFTADELKVFGSLYRKTCSDLSYARSHNYNPELLRYLNQLARNAYGMIYLSQAKTKGVIWKFLAHDFPALSRKYFVFIAISALLFVISCAAGYLLNQYDSGFVRLVVPPQILDGWDSKETVDLDPAMVPAMSSFYWTHNFGVGMQAFVYGITLGIGPLYMMIDNGLVFGALSSMVLQSNHHEPFFSFVISHSPIELMAIFICGAAGFMIGWALISPGELYRSDSLNKTGKEALLLVLGTIPMFLLAGIIESSISRLAIPIGYKIAFSLSTIAAMIFYFSYDGEKKKKRKFKIHG